MQKRRCVSLILLIIFLFTFSGCDRLDKLEVKLGLKNSDFEYIKQGKINKIIIQNNRDKGFRFTITDSSAISNLYDILSSAKKVDKKSSLTPDYTFEMQEGPDKIYKFSYVAGLDSKDGGNLYSGNKIYTVSNRLDNDIIKSLWNIRIPINFSEVYYNSIYSALKEYSKKADKSKKVGIDITDDLDVQRFILSVELEDFKQTLKNQYNFAELENKNTNYNIIMDIKTQGYRTGISINEYNSITGKKVKSLSSDGMATYKAIITISNKTDQSEIQYYIWGLYENNSWKIHVFTSKPDYFS